MQSLGVKLRIERERQKIGIPKIAEDTCISKRYLEAIEADDQSALPGEFFYRAFVRQYSSYLGWDPDEVEKQINLVSSQPSNGASAEVSVAGTGVTALQLNREQQVEALRETFKDKPMRRPQDREMSKWWLGFAALVIVGCVLYFGWRNFGGDIGKGAGTPVAQVPTPTPAAAVPVAAEPVAGEPVAAVPVAAMPVAVPPVSVPNANRPDANAPVKQTDNKQPEKTAEKTAAAAQIPVKAADIPATRPAAVGGQFSLTVRAKATTWVRITADGVKVYGGTIEAGQERTLNARDVELIVGNAGTLDVIYNGKPLAVGSKGEVKTLLINSGGWKVKPKPPTDPATSTTGNGAAGNAAPGTLQ